MHLLSFCLMKNAYFYAHVHSFLKTHVHSSLILLYDRFIHHLNHLRQSICEFLYHTLPRAIEIIVYVLTTLQFNEQEAYTTFSQRLGTLFSNKDAKGSSNKSDSSHIEVRSARINRETSKPFAEFELLISVHCSVQAWPCHKPVERLQTIL